MKLNLIAFQKHSLSIDESKTIFGGISEGGSIGGGEISDPILFDPIESDPPPAGGTGPKTVGSSGATIVNPGIIGTNPK